MRVVFFLLLLMVTAAYSQPPSPSSPESNQDKQRREKTVVNQVNPQRDVNGAKGGREENQSRQGDNDSDSPSNWWMIIPTIVIAGAAVFQAYIYKKQTHFMLRGLLVAKRSADAAKQSAETAKQSMMIALSPRLELRSISTLPIENPSMESFSGGFRLVNTGQSEARISKCLFDVVIGSPLPVEHPLDNLHGQPFVDTILKSGMSIGCSYPTKVRKLTHMEFIVLRNLKEFNGRASSVFLIGWVEYNYLGHDQRVKFCYRYSPKLKRFRKHRNPDYE
jgi:hypothetical protein